MKGIKYLFAVSIVLIQISCGGQKKKVVASSQLLNEIEQFGIDTIATEHKDTLCSQDIDKILRHYPELYHATKKAIKSYKIWSLATQEAPLKIRPEIMDVTNILDDVLFSVSEATTDSAWEYLPTIDSLYIQALVNIPSGQPDTDKKKTLIGRTRKAWNNYIKSLQEMEPSLPPNCYQHFHSVINLKTESLTDSKLYK